MGCAPKSDSTTTNSTETLLWYETGSRFDTNDVSRAQEEIPFKIVLPTYLPDDQENTNTHLPQITGTLKEYQSDNKTEIEIFYMIYLTNDIRGIVRINEANFPIIPGDPNVDPRYSNIEIGGKLIVKTEGDFAEGPGVVFFFNQDGVYFVVGVYNFSYEESVRIIESIDK